MKTIVSAFVSVLVVVSVASAQSYDAAFFARLQAGTPVDGRPGCVWAWGQFVRGPWGAWHHVCTTPQPAPEPTPAANTCEPWPSPYTERERFLACLAERPEPAAEDDSAPVTNYQVGTRYYMGYPSIVMIVLGVALGVDGTPHVLAQWLTDGAQHKAGDTFTFSAAEREPWMIYRGGVTP